MNEAKILLNNLTIGFGKNAKNRSGCVGSAIRKFGVELNYK